MVYLVCLVLHLQIMGVKRNYLMNNNITRGDIDLFIGLAAVAYSHCGRWRKALLTYLGP